MKSPSLSKSSALFWENTVLETYTVNAALLGLALLLRLHRGDMNHMVEVNNSSSAQAAKALLVS